MVAIAHGKGVAMCRQYEGRIMGARFVDVVREEFRRAFSASGDSKDELFLMDECPRQNAAVAGREWEKIGATLLKIPLTSPELNPIENILNLISTRLAQEALENEINKESLDELCHKVTKCMLGFDRKLVDAIIDTVDNK